MNQQFSLSQRVALLTGSTGHLGRAMARGLCQAGATVILNSRSAERVASQQADLRAEGWSVEGLAFDITAERQRVEAVGEIRRRHGRLDVLVNNAYAVDCANELESFRKGYEVIVTAAWALIQESLELLEVAASRNAGGASIINIASMYGVVSPEFRIYSQTTPPNPVYYGPAKAGLIQLTRYLACLLGPKNIRVNAISPGPFPAQGVVNADPVFVDHLGKKNPLGRIGQPSELIGPIVFLASDAASYVSGANLSVDGGWTAW